jgi:hypothetical protein
VPEAAAALLEAKAYRFIYTLKKSNGHVVPEKQILFLALLLLIGDLG